MTVKSKQIKTKRLYSAVTLLAADFHYNEPAEFWVPQDDITIIGAELFGEIYAEGTGYDSGAIFCIMELSLVPKLYQDATILTLGIVLDCHEATVGINANQVMLGENRKHATIMFPEGYGIDRDRSELVYLNTYLNNEMANTKRTYAYGTIFYVER